MGNSGLCLSIFLHVSLCLVLLCCLSVLHSGFPQTVATSRLGGNETDQLALLAFRAQISNDPLLAMTSWNRSIHFCQWHGVTCGRRHQRVTMLSLQSQQLVGTISPHIGNLSFLRVLHLQNNSFSGEMPPELGRLARLRYLHMNNNSISGEIPVNISGCTNLIGFDFSYNKLVGRAPVELGSLSNLQYILFDSNSPTGAIPFSFGNLSSLQKLSTITNNFEGSIPDALGHLTNLKFIALAENRLSGFIPPSIFNLSSITVFYVMSNLLRGSLPSDLGTTSLPNLRFLNIGDNQFTGSIPVSISNASNLRVLITLQNKFTGKMPTLEKLYKLLGLSISFNHLGNGEADDSSFLSSLTNATSLKVLALNNNNFGGVLPKSIGNLSTDLELLALAYNGISGNIPTGIQNLINLKGLYMGGNQFRGNIPTDIGKLQKLHELNFLGNKFSGNIPPSFGNLTFLIKLSLRENNLQGSIPSSLGKCQILLLLDLAQNNLSGTIPPQVVGLSSLSIYLDLSQNYLTGSIPLEIGNLKNLGAIYVSENMLSSEIPSTLGSCVRLEILCMDGNFFQGTIPSSLSSLRGIEVLDLSRNNLSGEIPEFFEGFGLLHNLNLSFNDFEGAMPTEGVFKNATATSVRGNSKLCGGVPKLELPRCNFEGFKKRGLTGILKLVISICSGFVGLALVLCFLLFVWFRKKTEETSSSSPENSILKLSYQNLLHATDGFSSANLVGVGSFGSVYKGILDHDGMVIAVKVLNLLRHGASKSFIAECEALRTIRHRNLVKVLTACSSVDYQGNDFKALVYEFMDNGSLEEWLHPNPSIDLAPEEPRKLTFLQRLNIAIDVACALDYLHHHCQAPIVHCDLKPSNVLLDSAMTGHVGDFGLAKFLPEATQNYSTNQTSSIGVRGSIGYTAPEYGMGSEVSTYGDVYSYGILLLEMFTGKRPTDDVFKDSLNLHNFAKVALPDQVLEVAVQNFFKK